MGYRLSKLKESTMDNTQIWDLKDKKVQAKIIKVYDGDTVWASFYLHNKIYRFNIRLYGIDTPEMKPPKDQENREKEIELSKLAKKYLEKLVLNKIITLELLGKEKYGRLLGKIYLKHGYLCFSTYLDVNKDMVDKDHAYEYYGKTKKNVN